MLCGQIIVSAKHSHLSVSRLVTSQFERGSGGEVL